MHSTKSSNNETKQEQPHFLAEYSSELLHALLEGEKEVLMRWLSEKGLWKELPDDFRLVVAQEVITRYLFSLDQDIIERIPVQIICQDAADILNNFYDKEDVSGINRWFADHFPIWFNEKASEEQ